MKKPEGTIDLVCINTMRTLAMDAVQAVQTRVIPARRWGWRRSRTRCGKSI